MKTSAWPQRLDSFCLYTAAFFPTALIMGNAAFEASVGLVGLAWIIGRLCFGGSGDNNSLRLLDFCRHPLILPWIFWYLSIVVSLLINGPGHKGWAHDIVFIRFLLFGMALIDISQRRNIAKPLIYGLAIGILWTTMNTISAYSIGYDFFGKPLTVYQEKLNMTGRIAGLTSYVAPLMTGFYLFDKNLNRFQRFAILAIILLSLFLVLHSTINTSIFATIVGIFTPIILFMYLRFSKQISLLVVAILISSFMGIIFSKFPLDPDRYFSLFDRFYIWKVVIKIWQENIFWGVGVSSFQDQFKAMVDSGVLSEVAKTPSGYPYSIEATHAHNLVLMLLTCTGIVGLSTFLWLFFSAMVKIAENIFSWRYGLFPWPVVLIVYGLTGYNIFHSWYQALFAYFLVLIAAQNRYQSMIQGEEFSHASTQM